jgi:flagellar basal body P-ring protein FlgI
VFDYPMVGDDLAVDGTLPVKVEGIGLVIGLNGTGSNPPPNDFRTAMLEEMKRMEIYKPNELLASKDTALVLLRAYVPAGIRKGEFIDVEVWVPPGDTTTSLKGGRLLEAGLTETLVGGERNVLKGKELIKVSGPVVVSTNQSNPNDKAALLKGKVLGQGRCLVERNFRFVLPENERNALRMKNVAFQINERFFEKEEGIETGLAKARDDKLLNLKLSSRYRHDIYRYLLVVRKIPMRSGAEFRETLLKDLKEELMKPANTMEAALRLESLGPEAIPFLAEGLSSDYEVVRFASAQALAYLGNGRGASELGRLAEVSTDYRAYALTALVALDGPAARLELSRLFQAESAEARYGAFRALWALDSKDALVQGEPMASQFYLHSVESKAAPMVHVSRNFRPEIVLFNQRQQLLTPFSLRAGDFILINSSGDGDKVHLACFRPGIAKNGPLRTESTVLLADVIREAAKLGATYGDIVDMLEQASTQGNLMGRLEVNALPKPLSLETLQQIAANDSSVRPPAVNAAPGLFNVIDAEKAVVPVAASGSMADNDESEKDEVAEKKEKKGFFSRILGN